MPDGFVKETATALVLRPREFLANARDLMTLKQSVSEQVPRYGEIKIPITIVAGDADATVSTARSRVPCRMRNSSYCKASATWCSKSRPKW
jgi:hypothetical protein